MDGSRVAAIETAVSKQTSSRPHRVILTSTRDLLVSSTGNFKVIIQDHMER